MKLLELLNIVNTQISEAAAYDRNFLMFNKIVKFIDHSKTIYEPESHYIKGLDRNIRGIQAAVQWATDTLKRNDIVVWYLRQYRTILLYRLMEDTKKEIDSRIKNTDPQWDAYNILNSISNIDKAETKKRTAEYIKILIARKQQLTQKVADNPGDENILFQLNDIPVIMNYINNDKGTLREIGNNTEVKATLAHFISLANNIPKLALYRFDNQTYNGATIELNTIERYWADRMSRVIPHNDVSDETEIIIKFPDGSQWVNLNANGCSVEAAAMGHCGNVGAYGNNTVLSYRTLSTDKEIRGWIPHLTFILDKDNGMLGEMKSYKNNKPTATYHPVIIELLKQSFIKGIVGGGYKPQNNFSLGDLSDDLKIGLINQKPQLGTFKEQYDIQGISDELVERIILDLGEIQSTINGATFTYDNNSKTFFAPINDHINDYVEEYGGDITKWINSVLNGDTYMDIGDSGGHLYIKLPEFMEGFSTDDTKYMHHWITTVYADEVDLWEKDKTDDFEEVEFLPEDISEFYDEYNMDEIKNLMLSAESDGREIGTLHEMYKAFKNWTNEGIPFSNNDFNGLYITYNNYESPVILHIPITLTLFMLSNEEIKEDLINEGDILNYAEVLDIDVPRYGFDEFDENAAKERFKELMYEELVE